MAKKRLETHGFDSITESEKLFGYKIEKVVVDGKEVTLYDGKTMTEFDQLQDEMRSRYRRDSLSREPLCFLFKDKN